MNAIDKSRLFLACLVIAEQESRETPKQQDEGPRQWIVSGGEMMELGPQDGGDIPF